MNKLAQIMAYLIGNSPPASPINNGRLAKLIYLADWRNCIKSDQQISDIEWRFNHYGPFVSDPLETAKKYRDIFEIKCDVTPGGQKVTYIKLKEAYTNKLIPDLTAKEKEILQDIIDGTQDLKWLDFVQLVYDTFPVATSQRYSVLNLPAIAKKFRALKEAEMIP